MNDFKPNPQLAKRLLPFAYIISAVIILVIVVLGTIQVPTDRDFSMLPLFHSTMNGMTFILLLLALYFIKQKKIIAHRNVIFCAMFTSLLFLVSYIIYHVTTPAVKFCGEGIIRPIYFFILITHIILAGIVLPFILVAFVRGLSFQVEKHKKLVRWVYPIWLYVAFTGPVIYILLKPCH